MRLLDNLLNGKQPTRNGRNERGGGTGSAAAACSSAAATSNANDGSRDIMPFSLQKYLDLPAFGKVQVEYVWLDGYNKLRGKARTLDKTWCSFAELVAAESLGDYLPDWSYDGSSTNQAPGANSDVVVKARAVFRDPFRGGDNIMVLCDTYDDKLEPIPSNTRHAAAKLFEQAHALHPWFGIEQEYFLLDNERGMPLGWPADTRKHPAPQAMYYCGVGAESVYGRAISDAHYRACLYAGIAVSGTNAEVAIGQWEFQVGPCEGIQSGDQLWMARYILHRVAEEANVRVSIHPKPVPNYNGSGAHTNFSTAAMREPGGYHHAIIPAIKKLEAVHAKHIAAYGDGNELRLTGDCETQSIDKFSWGAADRGASVRVGHEVSRRGCGYFEDRRPASNMDPYVVTALLVASTCDDLSLDA